MQNKESKFNWKLPLYGAIALGIGESIWFSITDATILLMWIWRLIGGVIAGLLLGAALGWAFKDKKKILRLSCTCALGSVIGLVIWHLLFGGLKCILVGLPILWGVVGVALGLVLKDKRKIPYLFLAGIFGSIVGIISVVMIEDFINYYLMWNFKGFFIIGSIIGASLGFMFAYVIKEGKNLIPPKYFLYPLITVLLIACVVFILPERLMLPEWSYQLDNDTRSVDIFDMENGKGIVAYSDNNIYAFNSEGGILWITKIVDNRSTEYEDDEESNNIKIFGTYYYNDEKDLVVSVRVNSLRGCCPEKVYLGINKSGEFKYLYNLERENYDSHYKTKKNILPNKTYTYEICCEEYKIFAKEVQSNGINYIYVFESENKIENCGCISYDCFGPICVEIGDRIYTSVSNNVYFFSDIDSDSEKETIAYNQEEKTIKVYESNRILTSLIKFKYQSILNLCGDLFLWKIILLILIIIIISILLTGKLRQNKNEIKQ